MKFIQKGNFNYFFINGYMGLLINLGAWMIPIILSIFSKKETEFTESQEIKPAEEKKFDFEAFLNSVIIQLPLIAFLMTC
jgi:hypothetical protein